MHQKQPPAKMAVLMGELEDVWPELICELLTTSSTQLSVSRKIVFMMPMLDIVLIGTLRITLTVFCLPTKTRF